jgi:hypothetical protein
LIVVAVPNFFFQVPNVLSTSGQNSIFGVTSGSPVIRPELSLELRYTSASRHINPELFDLWFAQPEQ